jgi:hypothetical protein
MQNLPMVMSRKNVGIALFLACFLCLHIYMKLNMLHFLESNLDSDLAYAPTFQHLSSTNATVDLDELTRNNHVVIINFWEQWCGPCRKEMPDLQKIYTENNSKGLAIVGIYSSSSEKSANEFIAENEITFPILYDEKHKLFDAYKVKAMPTTFVVDSNRKIIRASKGMDIHLHSFIDNYFAKNHPEGKK